MDLLEVLSVFKRHPFVTAIGVLIAALAVLMVSFRIVPASGASGASLAPRSYTTYTAHMQLMVVDSRFNVGRAGRPEDRTWDAYSTTVLLAKTYSTLLTSDMIRENAEDAVGTLRSVATARNLEQSPIIDLTLEGDDARRVRTEGLALSAALSEYLTSQQDTHKIPAEDRISITMLSNAKTPVVQESRNWEIVLLSILAPLLGAAGVGLAMDRGRMPRTRSDDAVRQ